MIDIYRDWLARQVPPHQTRVLNDKSPEVIASV